MFDSVLLTIDSIVNQLIENLISCSLGALFDQNVDENKQIFQYAIERVNEKLLAEEQFRLEGEVAEIEYGNELNISRSLCGLLEVHKK